MRLKELFFNNGQEYLVFSRRWGRFMFEATDGGLPDHSQASNFTHVSGRWQRLVFQEKNLRKMRRRLSWGRICAGSMPHFGSISDPVNSHFRAFSSQTPQTVPAKQRCVHQLFCASNGHSYRTFRNNRPRFHQFMEANSRSIGSGRHKSAR